MFKKIYEELVLIRKYLRVIYMDTEIYKTKDLVVEHEGLTYKVRRKDTETNLLDD